ncbi:uncharacterized protein LOC129578187 isoform X1 [Sitodiplosis mosellana]|uniref:uncharacterized protein LOC129578187 isoform X1 n=2 Tax=Sitodiplosis mosellana TaxID=263140 RepID=UPI002444D92D|nr:uncharacterized protein LOC129578187 isoform X1 [Sitodiplosis mosellana]
MPKIMKRKKHIMILPLQFFVSMELRNRREKLNYAEAGSTDYNDELEYGSDQLSPNLEDGLDQPPPTEISKTDEKEDVSVCSSISSTREPKLGIDNSQLIELRIGPVNCQSSSHHQYSTQVSRRANLNSKIQSPSISSSSSSSSPQHENSKTRKRKQTRDEIEKMKAEWEIEKERKEIDHKHKMEQKRLDHELLIAKMEMEHEQWMAKMAKKHKEEMEKIEKKEKILNTLKVNCQKCQKYDKSNQNK